MTTTTELAGSLYFEIRGDGPPVLLIPGTPGDGGQFDQLAEVLAESHLVITYDRAGTSRSTTGPAPTVAAHAEDAASLLHTHAAQPALVYGTSNGALVALELALRHPSLVERVIVHEPPLVSVLADPQPVGEMLGQLIGAAMEKGGPSAALEAFLRFAFGDPVVDGWSADLRRRMLDNAGMVFESEFPAFQAYQADPEAIAANPVPMTVAVGVDQQAPFLLEAATWIAGHAGVEVTRTPSAHGPHFTCPEALADAVFSA